MPLHLFFLSLLPPPLSTLFPYTTLFRSAPVAVAVEVPVHELVVVQDGGSHPGLLAFLLGGQFHAKLPGRDRKSTRLNSSHMSISYAVFCLKKKKNRKSTVLQVMKRTRID